jgi:hypothetical protein
LLLNTRQRKYSSSSKNTLCNECFSDIEVTCPYLTFTEMKVVRLHCSPQSAKANEMLSYPSAGHSLGPSLLFILYNPIPHPNEIRKSITE